MNRARFNSRILLTAALVVAAGWACGDSDETPLGSEFVDDLLGSRPGTVFEDTFQTAGRDTSNAVLWTIGRTDYMEVGLDDQYRRATLVRGDFSSADDELTLTVASANLRLNAIPDEQATPDYDQQIDVRFYNLGTPYYDDNDSLVVALDTTRAIPDPNNNGAIDRELSLGILAYALPPALVQGWIRGDSLNGGVAITYSGTLNRLFGMYTREAADSLEPSIQVFFEGLANPINYRMAADGSYVRPEATTDNLIISDGYVRRVHLPLDLSQIEDSSAVHDARLVLTYVPGSVFGINQGVLLYAPKSDDPLSEDFLSGQLITEATLDEGAGTLELRITNALLAVLSGELEDNGFVLRFRSERTEVRQAEFYSGTDADRGPQVYIIYSTPAEFEE
jgi:hypothetical protein